MISQSDKLLKQLRCRMIQRYEQGNDRSHWPEHRIVTSTHEWPRALLVRKEHVEEKGRGTGRRQVTPERTPPQSLVTCTAKI